MDKHPFHALPPTAQTHCDLYCYAAILRVLDEVLLACGAPEAAFEHFPFLAGYLNELAAFGLEGKPIDEAIAWWRAATATWEASVTARLPLVALRQALDITDDALVALATVGLIEEDPRFGAVFEVLQGLPGQHRPTLGLLSRWWPAGEDRSQWRSSLRRLQDIGLLQIANPEAPRVEWALQMPGVAWDAIRAEISDGGPQADAAHAAHAIALTSWARYWRPAGLGSLDDLPIPSAVAATVARLPQLLQAGDAGAVIVRGPRQNGRRKLLGAVAHALELGVLELHGLQTPEDERWRLAAALAILLPALPVFLLELGPGETGTLPALPGYAGPVGVVMGKSGGVQGDLVANAVTLHLPMPDAATRRICWQAALGGHPAPQLDVICAQMRLTSGAIEQVAPLAAAAAALDGRREVTPADARQARRSLNHQLLDTLAVGLAAAGDWSRLAVARETLDDLQHLELRCRHREKLGGALGRALAQGYTPGVRALFTGPSGAGKTLAARVLAASLEMDLYRVDLSTVVNKYIGETEKNLDQLFSRAEELDVILLLDEGDAMLTQRTAVQSANDRYANLETNYLLQRLESFEGIILITTNAGDRIDRAFQRRMDMVIDFSPPGANERWAIWQLHLPVVHAVDEAFLQEAAVRCALTGGQIRNAALHAALLALDNGGIVTTTYLEMAVQREYRKLGAVCPLRRG